MINRTRLLQAGAGLAVFLGMTACDNSKITELNNNPNNPEDVPAATLFTSAAQSAIGRFLGSGYSLRQTEFVVQHFAEQQYPDEDRYARLGATDTQGSFTNPYPNELEDLQKVVVKGTATNKAGLVGPAQILKAWEYSYITDTFGDIPYSAALAGDSLGGSITPAYDAQKDIYTDLFAKLDAAAKSLTGASAELGTADPIFKGDPTAWQKFANTLRARLALRLVNVDRAAADAQLRAAFAGPGGLIATNADNAILKWPGDGVYNNPWGTFFQTRDDNRLSKTLVDPMNAMKDPRLGVYAQPLPGTTNTYAGMPNGLTASAAGGYANTASRAGAIFFPGATAYGFFGGQGAAQASFIMTAAEMGFIQAEAAERSLGGLTPAQAKGFYDNAIRASMTQWGVTNTAAIDAYLADPAVAYKTGTPGLTQIALQKWIALFTDGGTAWAEWRRTCVPSTIKPGPAATQANVPRRFMYPTTEVSVNGAALNAAIARQGADAFTTRMYWDSAPTAAPTYTTGCGQR